jgi:hypothetical protein
MDLGGDRTTTDVSHEGMGLPLPGTGTGRRVAQMISK